MPAFKWLQETKGSIGAILFALAVIAALVGASRLPAKVDGISKKVDDHMMQMAETNHQLRVLVCLQARLDTPLRCVANTP
jgi:hypothetical protein